MPYTIVSASNVNVSQTSTCLATSTVSSGMTSTMAPAMKPPNSVHSATVTMPGRPNEATGSVSPGCWTLRVFLLAAGSAASAMRCASESPAGGGATSVPSPAGGTALLAT